MKTDTIAAIATAVSNSGISKIRISGSESLAIIDRIYKSKTGIKVLSKEKSHTIHYGYIIDDENIIDEVIVLIMLAPKSYTTEDIIEIDCHGGIIVTKKILETVIKYGARVAEPGEFTKRAFLNGRIDLSQAEAIIDIITAKNEFALKSSISQLRGNILLKIKSIRDNIIHDIAFIEVALDDPEHSDMDGFSDLLLKNVNKNIIELYKLLTKSDSGRILKEGLKTVIIGKPNVGKSSFLNLILGEDRAIVTDIEGTTRDTLEESVDFDGMLLNIVDTAGIRETLDKVEKIGVEKTLKSINEADLLVYLIDATAELDNNDMEIIELIKNKRVIVLLNKTDKESVINPNKIKDMTNKRVIKISAKENIGIDLFKESIKEMFYNGEVNFNDEVYITNIRQKAAINNAILSLEQVRISINESMPEDFYSIDLMEAYEVLGSIIGESVDEDLINTIFSDFCMGK